MSKWRGFTLVELLVTLIVMSLLLVVTVPSLSGMVGKYRVEGAAAELRTDLQYARSEAQRLGRPVRVRVNPDGEPVGYKIEYQKVDGSWETSTPLKSVTVATVLSLSASGAVAFDPFRGQATPNPAPEFTVTASGADGSLKVLVSAIGTPSMCAANGRFYGVSNACPASE